MILLILAVGNDGQFAKFCEAAGIAAWARDPRFAKNADRVRHRETLVPMVADVVKTKRQREWLDLVEPLGVPCGPINPIDRVFDEPQLASRGMKLDLPHPLAGSVPQVGFPLLLDGERSDARYLRRCSGSTRAKCSRHGWGTMTRGALRWSPPVS